MYGGDLRYDSSLRQNSSSAMNLWNQRRFMLPQLNGVTLIGHTFLFKMGEIVKNKKVFRHKLNQNPARKFPFNCILLNCILYLLRPLINVSIPLALGNSHAFLDLGRSSLDHLNLSDRPNLWNQGLGSALWNQGDSLAIQACIFWTCGCGGSYEDQ